MKLKVLGSGSCELRRGRSSPAYALVVESGEIILLDLGQGVWRRIAEEGLDVLRVRGVVISHHHLDHFSGIFPLLFALNYDPLLATAGHVEIVVHEQVRQVMAKMEEAFGRWVAPGPERVVWRWTGPDQELNLAGVRITTAQAEHIPASLAYRLEADGASIVYLGDSRICEHLSVLAKGADLLIAHCPSTPATPRELHMSPEEAGLLAEQAGVRALLLSHFYSDVNPSQAVAMAAKHFGGQVWAAKDGMEIDLGRGVQEGG